MWQYHIFTIVIEAFVKVACVLFLSQYIIYIYNFEENKCCPPNRLNNFIKDILLKKKNI